MTQTENIDSLIPFKNAESIIPGFINLNPNTFGTIILQSVVTTGTQMSLARPNSTRQFKFISSESLANETVRLEGTDDILELNPDGFAFLLYLKLGNDGRPINKWRIVGGHKFDIL